MIKRYNYLYSPHFLNYNISSNSVDISNESEKLEIQYIKEQEQDTKSLDSSKDILISSDSNKYFIQAFDFAFNNNLEEDTDNSNENKTHIFNVEFIGKKKKGRIPKNNKKRQKHDRNIDDNVITKIQTHYMKFIIDIINDCIPAEEKRYKKNRFKQFNHGDKRNSNKMHIEELKNSSINDLLKKFSVSPKYNCDEYANGKLVEKYTKENSFLKDLFKMDYLELFNYYYNGNRPTREIIINDRKIKLSKETKTFYDLIENKNNDKKHKERILEITEKIFKIKEA